VSSGFSLGTCDSFEFVLLAPFLDLLWISTAAAGSRERISEESLERHLRSRSPNVAGYKHHSLPSSPSLSPPPRCHVDSPLHIPSHHWMAPIALRQDSVTQRRLKRSGYTLIICLLVRWKSQDANGRIVCVSQSGFFSLVYSDILLPLTVS
jgi:hypothetical protein